MITIFALNPLRFAKMLTLAVWEYLTDVCQRTYRQLLGRTPRPLGRMFTFLRVMSNVVLRELQTFAVMIDIYRGVPAIYTTYYGYDEVAHHYGLLSKPALRSLRAIDNRIHQIDNLRRMALSREYDLYILSDHGMTPAVPFGWTYGQSLGDYVRELVGQGALVDDARVGSRGEIATRHLSEELEGIEPHLARPLAAITQKLRGKVAASEEDAEPISIDPGADVVDQVVVRNSGPLSHVYFTASDQPIELSQIVRLYPSMVDGLLRHEGIGVVAAREGDHVVIMSRDGVLLTGSDGECELDGLDPLSCYRLPLETAREIVKLASFRNSGDLILFGAFDPERVAVTCFEEMWACHGGIGGAQVEPFLVTEAVVDWQAERIDDPVALYDLFMARYGKPAGMASDKET